MKKNRNFARKISLIAATAAAFTMPVAAQAAPTGAGLIDSVTAEAGLLMDRIGVALEDLGGRIRVFGGRIRIF